MMYSLSIEYDKVRITGQRISGEGDIAVTIVDRGLVFDIELHSPNYKMNDIEPIIENMRKMHDSGICWMHIKEFYEL